MSDPLSDFPTGSHASLGRAAHIVVNDLMNVDNRWRALSRELADVHDSDEVRRLEQEVADQRRAKVTADQAAGDDELRLQRMRQDAAKLRARRRDDIKSLGAAVDGERRRDLTHDLAVAERRLQEVEEAITAEEQARRTGADADRARALEVAVAALEESRRSQDVRERELSGQCESLKEHSSALRAELPQDLLRRYERSEKENGVGAATLTGSVCRACFMSLDRASLAEILRAPEDSPASCPECDTMLLPDAGSYTDFVDQTHPAS